MIPIVQSKVQNKDLSARHFKVFKCDPLAFFSAPGRIELAGNHTDHNGGKVLAAAIDLNTTAAVSLRSDGRVFFDSAEFGLTEVGLDCLEALDSEYGSTASLIRGIAASIRRRGGVVGGFNALAVSTVPPGAGLSSSASVEILIARIFNALYNNGRFAQTELALMSCEAENVYFGKPCGLMDQLACAGHGIVRLDFHNQEEPLITPVRAQLGQLGYSLVIVNTGGSHSDLTPDYAAIPAEMSSVASFFGRPMLCQVEKDLFMDSLPHLRKALANDRAILRAMHFFAENERVDFMAKALEDGNISYYLELVRECGESSVFLLQNTFSPARPLSQELSLALAVSRRILGSEGACRLHGGGFAGTIQTVVPSDYAGAYIRQMDNLFGGGCAAEVHVVP